MADNDAQRVHERGLPHDPSQPHDDPREPGCGEVDQVEEGHGEVGVAAGPDVDDGESEGGGEEVDGTVEDGVVGEEVVEGEEGGGGEGEEDEEVGGAVAEGALLQVFTVADDEEHVEEEVEADVVEEEKVGDEAPVLVRLRDGRKAPQVQLDGAHQVEMNRQRRQAAGCQERTGDNGKTIIHF